MAIPKPNPDLPEEMWVESVMRGVCVHVELNHEVPSVPYRIPFSSRPWQVCEICAEELDRRLLEPSRNGWGRYCGREGIGREDRKRYDWSPR